MLLVCFTLTLNCSRITTLLTHRLIGRESKQHCAQSCWRTVFHFSLFLCQSQEGICTKLHTLLSSFWYWGQCVNKRGKDSLYFPPLLPLLVRIFLMIKFVDRMKDYLGPVIYPEISFRIIFKIWDQTSDSWNKVNQL